MCNVRVESYTFSQCLLVCLFFVCCTLDCKISHWHSDLIRFDSAELAILHSTPSQHQSPTEKHTIYEHNTRTVSSSLCLLLCLDQMIQRRLPLLLLPLPVPVQVPQSAFVKNRPVPILTRMRHQTNMTPSDTRVRMVMLHRRRRHHRLRAHPDQVRRNSFGSVHTAHLTLIAERR